MLLEKLDLGALPVVILSIAVMLFAGFLMTRLTKLVKLPNVTGYILAGIIIGPYALTVIPQSTIDGMEFIADIALAFIAFGAGRYLKLSSLRENGGKVSVITLLEALLAGAAVTLVMLYVFNMELPFALLIGSIASATAPASTIMTIRQYHAKGKFVDILLEVIALDNILSLVAFSVCSAIVTAMNGTGRISADVILQPVVLNLGGIMLGVVFGLLLRSFITQKRTPDNRLILAIAMLLTMTGLCAVVEISPLLACMAMGSAYINVSKDSEMFDRVAGFAPPILCMFFVLSGMRLDVPSLLTAGVIGVTYVLVRVVAKFGGAFVGAKVSKSPPEVQKFLGMALVPQAGVAIGLAILGQRILPEEQGALFSAIILFASVLYEIIGPAMAKWALHLAGTIPGDVPPSQPEEVCQNQTVLSEDSDLIINLHSGGKQ